MEGLFILVFITWSDSCQCLFGFCTSIGYGLDDRFRQSEEYESTCTSHEYGYSYSSERIVEDIVKSVDFIDICEVIYRVHTSTEHDRLHLIAEIGYDELTCFAYSYPSDDFHSFECTCCFCRTEKFVTRYLIPFHFFSFWRCACREIFHNDNIKIIINLSNTFLSCFCLFLSRFSRILVL